MKTLEFEGIKVALKQDKTGYVLTLSMHPDDAPEDLLRDFVGARYQVVMVRLNSDEGAMNRDIEFMLDKQVRLAGLICRNPSFWNYLYEGLQIMEETEKEATDWLRNYLNVKSRSELKTNEQARIVFSKLLKEFHEWKQKN